MTLANAPDRPRASNGRALWIAMAVAVAAVIAVALVVFGGRSRPASESRERGGGFQASSPSTQDVAGAVDATPAAGAMGPGAFGGPGSAADGTMGPLQPAGPQLAVAERARPQARRAPRRQAERQRAAEQPSYRAIGPSADEAAPPPPQT